MKKSILILITIFSVFQANRLFGITIHTIGDSTMEQKATDSISNPNGQRGWAQMLMLFVKNGATVNNRSKSGTSSKTFYEEKDANGNYRFWPTVKPQINPGDYVFIQFGHNDEKDGGWESTHNGVAYTGVGTNPWHLYTRYLCMYVNEVRALGAIPVLFTPIVRNSFSGTTMTAYACHNIGSDSIGRPIDYPAAMKKVADSLNVLLIDHTALTKAYCEQIGQSQTTSLIYNVGDGTHLGIFGATTYARLAAKELIRLGILTDYLNANPDLLVSPTSLAYGKCYANASSVSQISLSGTDLTPAEGTLTITAPDGYTLSTSQNGTYGKTLQYPYTLATINLTNFYVKFNPTIVGSYKDSLVLNNGIQTKKIAVSGECIAITGQKASAYWELSAAPGSVATQGPINVISETFSNMVLQSYAAPSSTATVWNGTTSWTGVAFSTTVKTQRNVISATGSVWPVGEIDIVNDRYIQFGVNAVPGTKFDVDSIGLYAGGAGGSGMRFKIYISKDSLFSNPDVTTMISDHGTSANTSNTMYPIAYNKLIELTSGQSLYLRVYPWYNGTATGKTICLYGLLIKGMVNASDASGLFSPEKNTLKAICTPSVTENSTTIKYTLNEETNTEIRLFSMEGKLLKYITTWQSPGDYSYDMQLSNFSSGVYFCKISTNSGNRILKIIRK